jgi:hypothetical protein
MDIRFACAQGHSLAVDPQYAGRRVRCPVCLEIVTAPTIPESAAPTIAAAVATVPLPPPAAEEDPGYELVEEEGPRRRRDQAPRRDRDEDDDYPRKKKGSKKRERREHREQLRKVDLGLLFHYWKYLTFVLSILLLMLGNLVAFALPPLAALLGVLAGLCTFVSPLLGIVGSVLCSFVPPRAEARLLILLSLGFDAGALGMALLAVVAFLLGPVALFFLLLCVVCGFTGFALFMCFLKKLAVYLDDRPAGEEAIAAMIAYFGVVFGGLLVILMLMALMIRAPFVGVLVVLAYGTWLVYLIKVVFRVLNVISGLRARL